jgi:lysozyme
MPYDDGVGVMTIGWGHAITPQDTFSYPINATMADLILQRDVQRFERCVLRVSTDLNQDQFDACVCLAFNIGEGAFQSSSVARLLRVKDYGNVPQYILKWNKGTVKGKLIELPGLTRRRKTEAKLFDTGSVTFNH